MKLEKIAVVMKKIKESFGLDMTDVLILDDIEQAQKKSGKVTIMEFIESCDVASQATIHARIKKMCNQKFLRKDVEEDNLRNKLLNFGPTYYQLVEAVRQF